MIRGQMFFQQGNAGWSESWYFAGNDVPAGLVKIRLIGGARAAFLSTGAVHIAIRSSLVGAQADSLVEEKNVIPTNSTAPDLAKVAALCKVRTATNQFRELLLRGLPDARTIDGQFVGSSTFDLAFQNFRNTVINNGGGIRGYNRNNPLFAIVSVSTTGLVTTFGTPPWDRGNLIRFNRTKDTNGRLVSGLYHVVSAPTTTTFQLSDWEAGRIVNKGEARLVEFVHFPVTDITPPYRSTTRQVGGIFGQPVGRRKSRV